MNRSQRLIVVLAAAAIAAPRAGFAQSHPEYVPLGRLSAALYKPDTGPAPHVGLLLMHRTANYMNHIGCRELSTRGFLALCMNTRFQNNEAQVRWEQTPLDVKAGVEFLRRQPGITKVVLFAHSGGGPLMSFYQAVAEKGAAYCQGPNKLVPCGDDLRGLPPADAIVFADAHAGNPVQTLRALNPSVVVDGGKLKVIRGIRSVRSEQWLQPERPFPLSTGIPGPLFQGAGRSDERKNPDGAERAGADESRRLSIPGR